MPSKRKTKTKVQQPRFVLKSWHYITGAQSGVRVFTTDSLVDAKRALKLLNTLKIFHNQPTVGDAVEAIAEVEMARKKRKAAEEKRRAFVKAQRVKRS